MQAEANRIIGLTGPIAAGKNEAAKILKRHGADVVDVDKLAHTLYQVQSPIWGELVKTFGSKILKRGGEINRKKLGEIVFTDKKQLQILNGIVHPALKEAVAKGIESSKQSAVSGKEIIVVNAAVLKEIGLVDDVDEVWVVMAARANRLKRLVKTGLSKEEALKRINAQAAQQDYLKIADVIIRNDGTLKQLDAKIQAYLQL
jgi:dephospho-CoA kinase